MSDVATIAVDWIARDLPLTPRGVVALSPAAVIAAARRLYARDAAGLAELRVLAAPGILVLLGPEGALPWFAGAVYIGAVPTTPDLLMPTLLQPTVPEALLLPALRRQYGRPQLLVLPDQMQVIPLDGAGEISREVVARWLPAVN